MHSYDHIRKLGQGAFGEVALARAVETGEVVALKRIFIRDASGGGLPDNVIREIKCMQSLEHPNVVQLKHVFAKGSSMVLVQEYCATDLASLLKKQHCRMPERCVKGLMQQMLRGLAACHAAGIMHRDIKPSNVLLTHGGCAKLGDFGLGRPFSLVPPAPGARPAAYTHTVATRWYRAPELLYGAKEYGPAVDVWSLGAVLAEMLGLGPLIPGDNDIDQLGRTIALLGSIEPQWPGVVDQPDYGKIIFAPAQPTPLEDVLPHASPEAISLLSSMLKYDPAQRIKPQEALRHLFFCTPPLPSSGPAIARELMAQG
mmetsp:Transcript_12253/g.33442  ORF Transcript_12253/g.33442 Transcript_12253/m.33442 type:complete len:314 (-) Transcript_12253:776-1717(-)